MNYLVPETKMEMETTVVIKESFKNFNFKEQKVYINVDDVFSIGNGQDRILKNETRKVLKKVGVLAGGITLALVVLWMIKRSTQVIARNIARMTSSWIPQEQPNEMAEVETISKAEPKPLLVI